MTDDALMGLGVAGEFGFDIDGVFSLATTSAELDTLPKTKNPTVPAMSTSRAIIMNPPINLRPIVIRMNFIIVR
jgi:hypothetical protein